MMNNDPMVAFFRDATLTRGEIDRFLDPTSPSWARFDSQLGYLPNDSDVPDNIDGAISEYRYGSIGERRMINHATDPCRLNTYGDSFTQCHQVSDGETWQEVLAAHLNEPIRNFGVGGYGVYQAATRLRRVEATEAGTPFVILNIYLDDHYRSIDSYRLLRLGRWWRDYDRSLSTSMFHANPWEHVRLDLESGGFEVRPNICPTPESLYNLCDTEFLVHHFRDDFVAQKLIADQSGQYGYLERYRDMATALGIDGSDLSPGARAHELWERCAFRATLQIVADLAEELQHAGKRLLVLLTYPAETVNAYLADGTRPDAMILEGMERLGISYVDGLELHAADYSGWGATPEEYTTRYYAGHYTPLGNALYAHMIKRSVVEWLVPSSPAYRSVPAFSFAAQAARLA